jgi:hypothetical protein
MLFHWGALPMSADTSFMGEAIAAFDEWANKADKAPY